MPDLSGIPVIGPALNAVGVGQPDQPTTPPDTSARDQIVAALATVHGGIFGKPAPQTTKGAGGALQSTGYDLYTFGDGTTVEVDPDTGATQNLKLAPVKTQATQTPQDVLATQGIYVIGGKVYQKGANGGPPIETDASKATQALADAKTRADAQLAQAQTQASELKSQLDADPTNIALQRQKQAADTALTDAQTASQQATAAATQIDTQLKQAAAPGQIALAGAQTQYQQALAASTAAKTALDNDPTNVALQRAKQQADTALAVAQAAATTKPTALTADTVAANIPTLDASGQVTYQPNQNQVTASEATSQLAAQLGLKVAAGTMSEKAAQDLITNAVNTMNAQTQQQQNQVTAAGDILSNVRGNAQTAAGMLQQRAQTAQGMLGQVLGLAQSGQRSGNFGGGLLSAPPGLGAGLVSGIGDWTSQLMGGQDTMDSAARLVQMADPRSNLADPASQQAVSALTQMLDKYHQITGAPHPAVAATTAMNQSQQNGGVVAPVTAPNPAYASTGAGAVSAGYGSSGNPWGNAPNGFPAPTTIQNPYASTGIGAVGSGWAAPNTASPTIVIHMPGAA